MGMQARIRTVKPTLFQHGELYDLEAATGLPVRLAFIGLWCYADREGRFEWKPRELKLNILPYDPHDFSAVLDALEQGGFLVSYEVEGKRYGWIPSLGKHQSFNAREAASTLPPPPGDALGAWQAATITAAFHVGKVWDEKPTTASVPDPVMKAVLARDENRCTKCPSTSDLTVDHIIPRSMGGTHSDVNLRTLCRPCNSARPTNGPELIREISEWYARLGCPMPPMPDIGSTVHAPDVHMQEGAGHVGNRIEGNGMEWNREKSLPVRAGEQGKVRPLPAIQGQRTLAAVRDRLGQVMAEVSAGARERLQRDQLLVMQAEMIFSYWAMKTGHEKSIFDAKRERTIIKLLEMNGGDVSELLYVIDGALRDDTIQGKRPDSTRKYDGIETIFRDRAQVERLAGIVKNYREGKTHKLVEKYAAAVRGDDAPPTGESHGD